MVEVARMAGVAAERLGRFGGLRRPLRHHWACFVGPGCGLVTMLLVASAYVHDAGGQAGYRHLLPVLALALAYGAVGAYVGFHRPRLPIGPLMAVVGLTQAASAATGVFRLSAGDPNSTVAVVGGLLEDVLHWPMQALLPLATLLLPDGRLPGRQWRVFVYLDLALLAALTLAGTVQPGAVGGAEEAADNPLGITWAEPATVWVGESSWCVLLVLDAAALAACLVRLRRASSAERPRTGWAVAAACGLVVGYAATYGHEMVWLVVVANAVFVTAIAMATLRRGLFGIKPLVGTTLLYAALSVMIVAAYVVGVELTRPLLPQQLASVATTGVVAVAWAPARDRVQRLINWWLFGLRDDWDEMIDQLGRVPVIEDGTRVLPETIRIIALALKLPYVAVELGSPPKAEDNPGFGTARVRLVAAEGKAVPVPLRFGLVHQTKPIGTLLVGPRPSGTTRRERVLLGVLANQVATVAGAVLAAGEERSRFRRDIHDGLGPQLAGITRRVEGALRHPPTSAEQTQVLLTLLHGYLQTAQDALKTAVAGLRVGVLDLLGLVGAARELGESLRLTLRVDVPEPLPALPHGVENSAYRIVAGALTNVARHAGTVDCRVCLTVEADCLVAEIIDDGCGRGDCPPGAGTAIMHELAAHHGGTVTITDGQNGGTHVVARLPLCKPPFTSEGDQL